MAKEKESEQVEAKVFRKFGASFCFLVAFLILASLLFPFPVRLSVIGYADQRIGNPINQRPWAASWATSLRGLICLAGILASTYVALNKRIGLDRRLATQTKVAAAWAALMSFCSVSSGESILVLLTWVPFFCIAALPASLRVKIQFTTGCLLALQLAVGLWAYLADVNQFHTYSIGSRASGLFGTPNAVYPLYMMSAVFFLAGSSRMRSTTWLYVPMYSMFLASALLVLWTLSRAAILGTAFALFVSSCFGRQRCIAISVGAVLLLSLAWIRGPLWNAGMLGDPSAIGHLESVEGSIELVRKAPLLGGGSHAYLRSEAYTLLLRRSRLAPYEPKNLAVHIAVEYGLVGSMPFVIMWLCGLTIGLRGREITGDPINRCTHEALTGVSVAVFASGLFDTPIFANSYRLPATVLYLSILACGIP